MGTPKKKRKIIPILTAIAIIGIPLFLAFYGAVFFALYPEIAAKHLANFLVLPLLTLGLLFWSITKNRIYKKQETKKFWKSLKNALFEAAIIIFIFFYIVRPVIAGAILFINSNVGHQQDVVLKGKIIAKKQYHSSYSYDHKLTIRTDSTTLIFDTDIKTIVHYRKGDSINMTMKRGCLGLLYKK